MTFFGLKMWFFSIFQRFFSVFSLFVKISYYSLHNPSDNQRKSTCFCQHNRQVFLGKYGIENSLEELQNEYSQQTYCNLNCIRFQSTWHQNWPPHLKNQVFCRGTKEMTIQAKSTTSLLQSPHKLQNIYSTRGRTPLTTLKPYRTVQYSISTSVFKILVFFLFLKTHTIQFLRWVIVFTV